MSSTRRAPKQPLSAYTKGELRYQVLFKANPQRAAKLAEMAQDAVNRRVAAYQQMAANAQPPKSATPKADY
jgi:hypothetical protein